MISSRPFPSASPRLEGVGDLLFCHATPRSDEENVTARTPADRVLPMLADARAPVIVCGHTHMQFDRMIGGTRLVNAGSVGMPFGERAAYWLRVGPVLQLMRTEYNLEEAAGRVRATGYPQAEAFLQPMSEAQALRMFE